MLIINPKFESHDILYLGGFYIFKPINVVRYVPYKCSRTLDSRYQDDIPCNKGKRNYHSLKHGEPEWKKENNDGLYYICEYSTDILKATHKQFKNL